VEQDFSSFLWSTGDTIGEIMVEESGTYTVEVNNQCGQFGTSFEVTFDCSFVFFLPNSFTPDGDEINDLFKGEGVGIEEYELSIFNRWGELVFESSDLNHGWNGQNLAGQDLQIGVYTYLVKINDVVGESHKYTGHVNLLR
jgi:gliding motility-associated-like protein